MRERRSIDHVRPVVDDVLDAPVGARQAVLEERCNGDDRLRADVESLVGLADRAERFLEPDPGAAAGRVIGRYRLIELIGRGGMGEVYRAVRADDEYRQEVAIKLIGAGRLTENAETRFRAERQLLADLEHPAIARLLDGGTTEEGRPYLVMEYVRGCPIDRYCREHRLACRERLELFQAVCAAVRHAHARLIVHCDLKPANVLVNEHGAPRLLDFGIARLHTDGAVHHPIGLTPGYASPEIVAGGAVSIATDVYALGVMLRELTTGARGSPHADLAAVIARATSEDPDTRYATVDQLVDEITRLLQRRPVRAREGGIAYRARRFVQRHVIGTLGAAALVTALLGVSIVAIAAFLRADAEAARAESVSAFLGETLALSDPYRGVGGGRSQRDLLDHAAKRIGPAYGHDDAVQAELHLQIGRAYRNLGELARAMPQLRSAVELAAETHGAGAHPTLRATRELARCLAISGNHDEAESLLRRCLERPDAIDERLRAAMMADLARLLRRDGRDDEALLLLERSLADRRGCLPAEDPELAEGLEQLANAVGAETPRRAEVLLDEALRIRKRTLPAGHPDIVQTWHNRAALAAETGDTAGAIRCAEQTLESVRAARGPDDAALLGPLTTLARLCAETGDDARADDLLAEAAELAVRVLPPTHYMGLYARQQYAERLVRREQYAAAAPHLQAVAAGLAELLGADHDRARDARDRATQVSRLVRRGG